MQVAVEYILLCHLLLQSLLGFQRRHHLAVNLAEGILHCQLLLLSHLDQLQQIKKHQSQNLQLVVEVILRDLERRRAAGRHTVGVARNGLLEHHDLLKEFLVGNRALESGDELRLAFDAHVGRGDDRAGEKR